MTSRDELLAFLERHYATSIDLGTPREYTPRHGWLVSCTCGTGVGESGDDDIEARHNNHVADALLELMELQ